MKYVVLYEQQFPGFYGWHTGHLLFEAQNDDEAEQKAFELIGREVTRRESAFRAKGIAKVIKTLSC